MKLEMGIGRVGRRMKKGRLDVGRLGYLRFGNVI
jgi:hypothetical protein